MSPGLRKTITYILIILIVFFVCILGVLLYTLSNGGSMDSALDFVLSNRQNNSDVSLNSGYSNTDGIKPTASLIPLPTGISQHPAQHHTYRLHLNLSRMNHLL